MKVAWIPDNEYSQIYESAEWQREDGLAPSRGIFNGVVIGAMLWVFCVWAWVKVARYF